MSNRALHRLLDAIAACAAIEEFIGDASYDDYAANYGLRLQVERLIEIIGEALNQARAYDPSIVESIKDVSLIVGMRNQLIHGYHSIDDDLVWAAAATRINGLRSELE